MTTDGEYNMKTEEFLKQMYGLTTEELLDPTKIKIIDGIAGSGKSSAMDAILHALGVNYYRTTPTHRLRRDAMERYGTEDVGTIAGTLFTTEDGIFYKEQKDISFTTLVIDEILLSDTRTWEWADAHKGDVNIIITTDSHQLLTPYTGEAMLKKFSEWIKREDVIYKQLTKTHRARTAETEEQYNDAYQKAAENITYWAKGLAKNYRSIQYEDMPYNQNDIYLTHTKAIEDYMYRQKKLYNDRENLIAKGKIAKDGRTNNNNIPIVSQQQAEDEGLQYYYQHTNVATPTRYQGAEVKNEQTLYYIVEARSAITSREWYTVLTRCYNINSICFVFVKLPELLSNKTFCGAPVKPRKVYDMTEYIDGFNASIPQSEIDKCIDPMQITNQDIYLAIYQNEGEPENREFFYKANEYIYNGKHYYTEGYTPEEPEEKAKGKRKAGFTTYLSKCPELTASYTPYLYDRISELKIDRITYPTAGNKGNGDKHDYKYDLDLWSAYPTILRYEDIPTDGAFYTDKPHEGMMNFYGIKSDLLTSYSIAEEKLTDYIRAHDANAEITYICSTEYEHGTLFGALTHAQAHKTRESKKALKEIKWGIGAKQYIEALNISEKFINFGRYDATGYYKQDFTKCQLVLVAINSYATLYMLRLHDAIGGYIQRDAVHTNADPDEIIKRAKAILPDFLDYRIQGKKKYSRWDGTTGYGEHPDDIVATLYQTCPDLPSRKAGSKTAAAKRQAKHRAEMTEEQRAEARAKDAERKRLARAKKKAKNV